jgi:hypothetical protein
MWGATKEGTLLASADSGTTWKPVATVPDGARIWDIAVDGTNPLTLWVVDRPGRLWTFTLP